MEDKELGKHVEEGLEVRCQMDEMLSHLIILIIVHTNYGGRGWGLNYSSVDIQ